MDEMNKARDDLHDALDKAQLLKTLLEVQNLKRTRKESKSARNQSFLTIVIAALGFGWGIGWGIYQFTAQQALSQREQNEAKEKEFKKTLWERQLGLYLETSQAAATLARFNENAGKEIQPERTKALIRFWQLYYGEMAVVADDNVRRAMTQFGRCLREYDQKNCDQDALKQAALALAQECRNSVAKSWNEPLGQLERQAN
jgi:hypothetical protein